jgi:mRNA interferase RelE/StbE
MAYRVLISNRAHKQIGRLDHKAQALLYSFINKNLEGCDDPRAVGDNKKLEGAQNAWRYRVGSYRIIVSIHDDELIIEIVQAGHRQGVYRRII